MRTMVSFRVLVFEMASTSGVRRASHLRKSALRTATRPACYAVKYNQVAYFNFKTGKSVPVGGTGEKPKGRQGDRQRQGPTAPRTAHGERVRGALQEVDWRGSDGGTTQVSARDIRTAVLKSNLRHDPRSGQLSSIGS